MHRMFLIGEKLRQGPECILLIHVHQQNGCNLTHALAVAHLLQETRPVNYYHNYIHIT